MNKLIVYAVTFFLSACASTPNVTQGENPGKDAIVIVKFNLIPDNSPVIPNDKPVYIQVRENPLFGPIRKFSVEKENPYSVITLEPGIWEWYIVQNLKNPAPFDNTETHTHFKVYPGCINYLGDTTFNFGDSITKITDEPPNDATLNQFKSKYPKMFAANHVCQ